MAGAGVLQRATGRADLLPRAAAGWCALFAAVQAGWVLSGTVVPWSPHLAYAPALQLLLVFVGGAGAVACAVSARKSAGRGRAAVAAALAAAAVALVGGTLCLPVYVVGLLALDGVESVTGLVHVLLSAVGAALVVPLALAYGRELRGRCARCGGRHRTGRAGGLRRPAPTPAARRTRIAAWLGTAGLLPWAAVKTYWNLGGDALGVTAEQWRASAADASALERALASVGVDITVLASGLGVFLAAGLLYPWGQLFPRWVPLWAGRPVPRLLPLLPAWGCGVGLSLYGVFLLGYTLLVLIGVLPRTADSAPFTPDGLMWMVVFGGLAFGGLGFAMLTGARSYAARTRPRCTADRAAADSPGGV